MLLYNNSLMKKTIIPLILFCFISCGVEDNQTTNCSNVKQISLDTEICIPTISNYIDCITSPLIKSHIANTFPVDNNILAYYLSNEDKKILEKNEEVPFEDYFTIAIPNDWINLMTDRKQLKSMMDAIDKNYFQENWQDILKKSPNQNQLFIPDVPTIVSKKNINQDIYSTIILTKYGNEKIPLLFSTNVILIKNKMFAISYSLKYNGAPSINTMWEKNEKIALEFYKANKDSKD